MADQDNSDAIPQPSGADPSELIATPASTSAPTGSSSAPATGGTANPSSDPPLPSPATGATPGSYSAVLGTPMNIGVPSEAPSPLTATLTGLPSDGTVVLEDGSTPVQVGQGLSMAQLAGLRFKPRGTPPSVPQSFAWDQGASGIPTTHKSVPVPDGRGHKYRCDIGTYYHRGYHHRRPQYRGCARKREPYCPREPEAGNAAEPVADCPGAGFYANSRIYRQHEHPCRGHRSIQNQ